MKLKDSYLFRFLFFVLMPACFIIYGCLNPGGYYTGLINLFGINIILVASLNLVNGFSGMFSMGHAAFMAIGAYTSALLTIPAAQKAMSMPGLPEFIKNANVPFVVALLFAGIFSAIVALLIGFPVLRFKGHYLSIATLGLIVIVRAVLDNEDELTNGARGITGLPDYASTGIIFAVAIVSLFVLYRLVRKSSYGRGLIAMRDDYVAAQTLGINLTTKKISAFCISAFIAGMGGALWGHMQSVVSGKFFYFDQSFKIVQTSIIGGMASLSGSIPGSLVMTFLPEFLAPLETGITVFGVKLPELYGASNLIMAAFLIVLIIFRRQGIMGESEVIVESIFSLKTYTSIFKKSEYVKLGKTIKYKLTHIGKSKKNISTDTKNSKNS